MLKKLLSLCLVFAILVMFVGCQQPQACGPDCQKACCAKAGKTCPPDCTKPCCAKKGDAKKCPMSGKTKDEGQK